MKTTILVLMAGLILVGCSKDGAGQRLVDGGQIETQPLPTDANLPGPQQ